MRAAPRAWHFVATAVALAVLLVGSYLFFVQGYMGQLIDEQARTGAQFAVVAQASNLLDAVPLLSAGLVLIAVVIGAIRRQGAATVVALDRIFDRASVFVMSGPSFRGRSCETLSVEAVPTVARARA